MNYEKPLIIGTIGIPACGKTTLAEWYKEHLPNTVVICRDDIRKELFEANGEVFTWDEYNKKSRDEIESEVTKIHKSRFVQALKDGKNIIIPDTWLTKMYRDEYNHIAENFDNEIMWEYLHVNLYEAILRDKNRENPVGELAIKIMHQKLINDPDNREYIYKYFTKELENAVVANTMVGNKPVKYLVSDLDGTFLTRDTSIENVRDWYDFDRVDEDVANLPIAKLVMQTSISQDLQLVFATGRDESIAYDKSVACLNREILKLGYTPEFALYARGKDDRRPDWLTKLEIMVEIVEARGAYPTYMFDDRASVVEAMREVLEPKGVWILQVAKGNF